MIPRDVLFFSNGYHDIGFVTLFLYPVFCWKSFDKCVLNVKLSVVINA